MKFKSSEFGFFNLILRVIVVNDKRWNYIVFVLDTIPIPLLHLHFSVSVVNSRRFQKYRLPECIYSILYLLKNAIAPLLFSFRHKPSLLSQ